MTLKLAQRSSKVIDFGTNRKRVYIFILVVNSNLDSTCIIESKLLLTTNSLYLVPFPRYGGSNDDKRRAVAAQTARSLCKF